MSANGEEVVLEYIHRIKNIAPKELSIEEAESLLKGAQKTLQSWSSSGVATVPDSIQKTKQWADVLLHYAEQIAYAKAQFAALEEDIALLRAAPQHTTEIAKKWRAALNGIWLIRPSKIAMQKDFWQALETHFPAEGAMKLMSPEASIGVWHKLSKETLLAEIQVCMACSTPYSMMLNRVNKRHSLKSKKVVIRHQRQP